MEGLFFAIGFLLGGVCGVLVMCLLQINRRYYEDIASRIVGPAGIRADGCGRFQNLQRHLWHYAGDMALKAAAAAIRSCIRDSDLLIRYGGDEFLLVLPGIPGDILQAKLEQIRAAVQQATVPVIRISPLTEHRRNDAGHHRPDGECGSPGRPADVSGKVPQECRHGGTPRKRADRAGRTGGGEAADSSCG